MKYAAVPNFSLDTEGAEGERQASSQQGGLRLLLAEEPLPEGWALATCQQVRDRPAAHARVMPTWQIARLAEDGWADGVLYGCETGRDKEKRASLGHQLIIPVGAEKAPPLEAWEIDVEEGAPTGRDHASRQRLLRAPQCNITMDEASADDRSAWRPDPHGIYLDWILFALGWVFLGTWYAGMILPLLRTPRFPSATNKAGWIANVVGSSVFFSIVISRISEVLHELSAAKGF